MASLEIPEHKKPASTEDEMHAAQLSLSASAGDRPSITWTPREERRAVLKADVCILGFIMLLFCFMQFDRTSISSALTDTLRKDIHVGNTQVNLSQTLFTLGFVLTELPFNMISRRLGPERFLPITMLLWGVVTWSQMFIKDARGLCAARFFVGALEGGFIPGMTLYLAQFYTNGQLASRYALFWASNNIAGALGGPLAIGLLSLGGRGGLKGWQWLWLIEGVLTCVLAVAAYLYLPHTASTPKRLLPFRIFTQREATILTTRVVLDDPSKALPTRPRTVHLTHIASTLADWRLYGHLVSAFLSMLMIAPMNTYAPSLIQSLGFTRLAANGMNSVGSVACLCVSVALAFSSDRFRERGVHVAVGMAWGAVGLLWLALPGAGVSKWVLYAAVVVTQSGMGSAQAINAAWLATTVEEHKRPVALAAYVMAIQIANFPGNQLFRAQDAPRYRRGLIIAAACALAGAVVALVWKIVYRVCGVEGRKKGDAEEIVVEGVQEA